MGYFIDWFWLVLDTEVRRQTTKSDYTFTVKQVNIERHVRLFSSAAYKDFTENLYYSAMRWPTRNKTVLLVRSNIKQNMINRHRKHQTQA